MQFKENSNPQPNLSAKVHVPAKLIIQSAYDFSEVAKNKQIVFNQPTDLISTGVTE